MARKRWAVRCVGHHGDGSPCKGWAIVGGRVCAAHGGSAPTTRWAAARRVQLDDMVRAANAEDESLRVREALWYVRRCQVAAEAAGDVDPVTLARRPALLGGIEEQFGIVPPRRPRPTRDRRFRARREGFGEDLPPLPRNSRMPARTGHYPHCPHWPRPGTAWCPQGAMRLFYEIDTQLADVRAAERDALRVGL